METNGQWYKGFLDTECQWNINYSDILTKLIQYAGRYCEHYASDLFIIWKYDIDKNLTNKDWTGCELKLGFREMGVDHGVTVDNNYKENRYYYRKIVTLTVTIDGERIKMELK